MSEVNDPLADPRAVELLAAAPDEVGVLAADFRTASEESQATATGLRAAQHDGTWTGPAAGAFRRAIGRVPVELDRVRSGFDGVAAALSSYESALAGLRVAFELVVAELQAARARLALARAEGRPDARDAAFVADLEQRALVLLDEFTAARDACHAAIAVAQEGALRAPARGQGTTTVDLAQRWGGP